MANTRKSRARRYAARVWVPAGTMPTLPRGLFDPEAAKEAFLSDRGYWFAPGWRIHGVWNTYNNWYCRCPLCVECNTHRQARKRHDG